MKIGIYDPYLDTLSGGEKYMLTAAACFSKDSDVYLFWDENREYIKSEAKRKLGVDLADVKFTKNIFSRSYPRILRVFNSRKFDAIIFFSDGSIPLISTRLFVIFQFPVEWTDNNLKTRIKISRIEKIICYSEYTKRYIDRKFNVKSLVLFPPCENKSSKVQKENLILHVGRFGKNLEGKNFKKQDVMIDAFKKLNVKNWKFILVVGRSESQKKDVQKLRDKTRGYPIEIIENPSNTDLWRIYSKAKIYWHASGFGEDLNRFPERAEHFGISTVEAMVAGAVPVVINAGGQPEIVVDGMSGFLWNSIDELLNKTQTLIKDRALLDKMSRNAVLRSKKFSKDRFCKELKSLI